MHTVDIFYVIFKRTAQQCGLSLQLLQQLVCVMYSERWEHYIAGAGAATDAGAQCH